MRNVKLSKAAILLIATAWLSMLVAAGIVGTLGVSDRIAQGDAVIVPGNTVNPDGTLSHRLQARLDVALAVYRAGRCKVILVSGATGVEGVDEAAAMKAYLVQRGVGPDRILQDSQGFNTEATARNAARILGARGYRTVVAASQFFHIPRLRRLLSAQGLQVVGNEHARYFEFRDAYSLMREVLALGVVLA